MSNLPTNWAHCNLGDLIENIEAGLNVKCEERPPEKGERGLVKISAVTWGRFDEMQSKTLPSDAMPDLRKKINQGDLLFSRANTLELVGASVIVHDIKKELYLSDKVLRLVIADGMKSWVNYGLKTQAMRKAIGAASSGNQLSMRNISQDKLKALELPVAPLAEQHRIADKLDTTLARVDALNNRLARITPLLKRFRQSVLAAATSGRLTEDWRGGAPNWNEERLGKLAKFIDYRGKTPQKTATGVPLITAKNVKPGYLNEEPREFIADEDYDSWMTRGFPKAGDVLLTTEAPLGNVVLIDWKYKFALAQRLICLSFDERIIGAYAAIAIQSQEFQKKLIEQSSGSTVAGIKASRLKELILSTPSINEQTEIVRRVETLFAFAGRLESRLQSAQTAAERLTPALLAKAFRGELVPQDPNDEPATKLLRRLREARAAQAPTKPKRERNATTLNKR